MQRTLAKIHHLLLVGIMLWLSASVGILFADEHSLNLQPGDQIQIIFLGEPDFELPFDIDGEGNIQLPEFGTVKLSGITIDEALLKITSALQPYYRNLSRISLSLKARRLAVRVLGYVKLPGLIYLDNDATVQMAINAAGGLLQGAQLDKLQHRRVGQEPIIFNYKTYLDTGDSTILPELNPMDEIFIPASPLIGNVQVDFDAQTLLASGDASDDKNSVTVFGEVPRPGTFGYQPEMTVIDFLMRAGGVTRYAGVEQIRIIHEGVPAPFDMRGYLDTGDRDKMPDLASGDIIYVPQAVEGIRSGVSNVFVIGEVFKPGPYETKGEATFLEILANAGGPTRYAETRQVRILRADGTTVPFNLAAFTEGNSAVEMPRVAAGDAIFVPEKLDVNEKSWLKVPSSRAVGLIGAVARPGRYEWSDEMTLLDLLAHSGGPNQSSDLANMQVIRAPVNGVSALPIYFNLKRYLENPDLPLVDIFSGDTIVVPELPDDPNDNRSKWISQSSKNSIYIFGQVGAPGRYAFSEELNFLDILSAAQGPNGNADLANIKVTHRNGEYMKVSDLNLHLYFETGDESVLPSVKNEDVIYVPSLTRNWIEKEKEETIRILGAVGRPGRYPFSDSMTILDLLAEAGGPTVNAKQNSIVVINEGATNDQSHVFDLVKFAKNGDFSTLPVIRNGDTIYIPDKSQGTWRTGLNFLDDILNVAAFIIFFR